MFLLRGMYCVALAAALAAAPAFAVEVVMTAPAGANGAHGVPTGGAGTAGQKGGDAVVSEQSIPGLPSLTVRATGGVGGTGGNGAAGSDVIPGGAAGIGGPGGNAFAEARPALAAPSSSLHSFAVGGRGGNAGRPGSPGGRGAAAGTGGNASSFAESASSGGTASATASSIAGRGGDAFGLGGRAGDGGTGQARARANSLSEMAGAGVQVQGGKGGTGFGGAAAGNGGTARLDNAAEATAGMRANVRQIATGGSGGDAVGVIGGRGGDASITQIVTTNVGHYQSEAQATGGSGGIGSAAGRVGDANIQMSIINTRSNARTWATAASTAGRSSSTEASGLASARLDVTAASGASTSVRADGGLGHTGGRADATSNVKAGDYAHSHALAHGRVARSIATAQGGQPIASAETAGADAGATAMTRANNGAYQGARSYVSGGSLGGNATAGVTVENRATTLTASASILSGSAEASAEVTTGAMAPPTDLSEAYLPTVVVKSAVGMNYGHRDELLETAPESRAALDGLQVIAAGSQAFALVAEHTGRELEARHSLSFVAEKDSPLVLAMLGITGDPVGAIAFELWINGELVMSESLDSVANIVGFFYDNVFDLEAIEGGTLQQIDLVTRPLGDDPIRFGFAFAIGVDGTPLAAVPEPSIWAMMIGGLLVLLVVGWRRARVTPQA